MRERISTVLPLGQRETVRGLAEAIAGTKNELLIQNVAIALGVIQYSHAVPQLREVSLRKGITPSTLKIVKAALISCSDDDKSVVKKPLAELYYKTALKYYYRHDSVVPDKRYPTANVWYFSDGVLIYKSVPREIFCDIYAMRMARKTLQADAEYSPAVSLWLASYLRRESNLPEGAKDPLVPATQGRAGDYVRAAGANYAQQVLARALRDGHTPVALGAIKALRDVAGDKNLSKIIDRSSVQPLVAAMSYPDRRVRFLSAEVLAMALPTEVYSGYQVVIPVLSDALREGGSKRALLMATGKTLNVLTDALRNKGYQVIGAAEPLAAMTAARQAGGVDVAIISDARLGVRLVDLMRRDPSMATLPVIIVGRATALRPMAKADGRVVLVSAGEAVAGVLAALPKAESLTAGKPLTPEEASEWAVRAAKAIRHLGITANKVYSINRAQKTLIGVLKDKRVAVAVAAANALAVMPDPKAQQAIARMADGADSSADIRVPAYVALAESVRRFGNQLTKPQCQAVVDVVNSGIEIAIRQAAAGALGALNLPSNLASPLIIDASGID